DFKLVMMKKLNDDSNKFEYFNDYQASILNLNVHEKKQWLVISSCDGGIRVFNIDIQSLIKQLSTTTKSNDYEPIASLCQTQLESN
ncbi:unnamed protein product, partial [Rotaria sp. Silwood2]